MQEFRKYPRVSHLPWSLGRGRDDLVLATADIFEGKEIVVTEKLGGENTSMRRNSINARSLTSSSWFLKILRQRLKTECSPQILLREEKKTQYTRIPMPSGYSKTEN
jgi:hypothetical protein